MHESGHYIVARWCGIRSEVFSIGFGTVLWSRRDSRGTLWQVAALPLGGYVKFLGDTDARAGPTASALDDMTAAERRASFHGAAVWRRMLTVLAGPVFNFLLTIVVFAGIALWQGMPTERPTIGGIAALPGVEQPLRPGDVLLAVKAGRSAGFEDIYPPPRRCPSPGRCRSGSSAAARRSSSTCPTRCRRWCRASSRCRRRARPASGAAT